MTWGALLKFWWVPLCAALVVTVLLQRNDITSKKAAIDAAATRITDLDNANRNQKAALDKVTAARIDNDAIAVAVAAKLQGNTVRETNTRTIIEKAAANDPVIRDWASEPVPGGVRDALRAR
jgi:hypothetical protein